ncbi:MAG: PEP-utilizing enzyme [Deltaproteobacteria bacterium]|jgi:pyruvate,orthophosphate dikinase|nr:PEP-utilizing enzyme [Deltaproteobacteria bacterium]
MTKWKNTYFFAKDVSIPEFEDKTKDELKTVLGGKGYGLYLMHCVLNINCPTVLNLPAFHAHNLVEGELPKDLKADVKKGLHEMEKYTGKKFGDPKNPLLVSARSGAKFSMPGMMDTILNIGLNDSILAELVKGDNVRFWLDSYRRLLQMYGDVVLQIKNSEGEDPFEMTLDNFKKELQVKNDLELGIDELNNLIKKYKEIYKEFGHEFPQNPEIQIIKSAEAVFRSWSNERAIFTRQQEGIPHNLGTAVNLQEMVFGNKTPRSATGVFFTRDKSTGHKSEDHLEGTVLFQAQGEDVVAGIRNSLPLEALRDHEDKAFRDIYYEIKETGDMLEKKLKNMQDAEFTIEEQDGEPVLFWLQIRDGKRSAQAESVIAVAMQKEGIVNKKEALKMINPDRFAELLFPRITPEVKKEAKLLTKGSSASPGAVNGKVVFNKNDAIALSEKGEDVILVTVMTSQEDVKGMKASKGILTTTGTKVSHAAIMATAWGIPAVVGADEIKIDRKKQQISVNGTTINKGDYITISGTTGEVFAGQVSTVIPEELGEEAQTILKWAAEFKSLKVRANAEASETQSAKNKGARGIGLFRTEHMFLGDRLPFIQEVLFGDNDDKKKKSLTKIYEFSKEDFKKSMKIMDGYGVTIRLLDAPLHEFFPHDSGMEREENPMLGHRSVRMAITNPEIPRTQIKAILVAAMELKDEGFDPKPEIEVPLAIIPAEVSELKNIACQVASEIHEEYGKWVSYGFGIMVETPAAALQGKEMVQTLQSKLPDFPEEAHPSHLFASFGTNDLTQTTLAISRDDADKFLPHYVEHAFFKRHPFVSIHPVVEKLVKTFVDDARSVDPKFETFICGEHGGDVYTVGRLHEIGLTGISMSPGKVYRSIIKAGQAQVENPR